MFKIVVYFDTIHQVSETIGAVVIMDVWCTIYWHKVHKSSQNHALEYILDIF